MVPLIVARTGLGRNDCRMAILMKQVLLLQMNRRLWKRSAKNVDASAASRIDVRQVKLSGLVIREKHSCAECLAKPYGSFFDIEHSPELRSRECAANNVEVV